VYSITSIILAAGEGKRMYSKVPKVLHKVCGTPMVEHVINCARSLGDKEPVVVIGHGADQVSKAISGVKFIMQEKQLGTGHAVMQAEKYISDGDILILYGDTPLLRPEVLMDMHETHRREGYSATILTSDFQDPTGYGRIIRNEAGLVDAIVEEKDADSGTRLIKEINSGIYFFSGIELKKALSELNNNNAQGEYYLTDVIGIMRAKGLLIGAYKINDNEDIMGVNNRYQLSEANSIMGKRIAKQFMLRGVTILDPATTYIEAGVKLERDVTIYPGCILEGDTVIEEDSVIGPNSRIRNGRIGKGVNVQNSIVLDSTIGEGTTVGPFAYIRPGNKIGRFARIGDFVEMKNTNFGDYSKASHLTYVGDGDVGNNVNLGCGVVFVNYDGKHKNRSYVGDNSFIGCNVNLIAPVRVNANSYVAAGTTVTHEVPKDSLAIGRARQENKEGWVTERENK
ncbi:MAG TPA: bifunctional UDP-N-acetylglucosamine diphosphorylase/glucosamine-1-phosphate N-acetyltransferase GlmU, partial [Negativicutes bacterium]|nr:bifunctional UDP-N-acetylglucosamine diphosphorylase/glucosamine-1-phosphate N-acetyltransferase GlmU [Negativicutes bacterium]